MTNVEVLFRACYLLPSIFLVRYSIFRKAVPKEAFHTLARGSSCLDPPYIFPRSCGSGCCKKLTRPARQGAGVHLGGESATCGGPEKPVLRPFSSLQRPPGRSVHLEFDTPRAGPIFSCTRASGRGVGRRRGRSSWELEGILPRLFLFLPLCQGATADAWQMGSYGISCSGAGGWGQGGLGRSAARDPFLRRP